MDRGDIGCAVHARPDLACTNVVQTGHIVVVVIVVMKSHEKARKKFQLNFF